MTEKKPVVFGIGGLLERGEKGQVTDMLKIMAEYGCRTYEVTFANINRDGNTIMCSIGPNDFGALHAAINAAKSDKGSDMNRVGVIVSSMGAAPFIEYLANIGDLNAGLRAYAANVPFARINPDARKVVTRQLAKKEDLDISSVYDIQKGQRRLVQVSSLPYLLEFDATNRLATAANKYKMSPFTILAKADERVDNQAIIESHRMLGGLEDNIHRVEGKHTVPYEISRGPIIEFMVKALDLQCIKQE